MRARERRGENIVHLIIEKKRGEWKRKCSEYKKGKNTKKSKERERTKQNRESGARGMRRGSGWRRHACIGTRSGWDASSWNGFRRSEIAKKNKEIYVEIDKKKYWIRE